MECPKCGSVNFAICAVSLKDYYDRTYRCKECDTKFKYGDCHKQRLDKVLSKFEDNQRLLLNGSLHILSISNDEFLLVGGNENIKISLDTVESLIKDMEVE